jgi:sulfoxide reductase heme-binding subunit YedZ
MPDPRFAKTLVFVNCSVPLALLAWDSYFGNLGANPIEYALHTTGMLTLIFLMLTLAVTPARKLSGWNWLSNFRRTLGLYAFAYGSLHLLINMARYETLSLDVVLSDMFRHKYMYVGLTGWLMMVPLAITSTNAMIKRMGAKKWKALHRLVYLSAIAGVVHYYWLVKADTRKPIAFGVVLGILLLYRILEKEFPILRRRPVVVARAASNRV